MAGPVAAEGLERGKNAVARLACVHAATGGGGGAAAPLGGGDGGLRVAVVLLGRIVMLRIDMIVS